MRMSRTCSLGRDDIVMIDETIRVFERLDEVLGAILVGGARKMSKWQPYRSDAARQDNHLMCLDFNAGELVEQPLDLGPHVDPDRSILPGQKIVSDISEALRVERVRKGPCEH